MQYYSCKCGKREFWGSGMISRNCEVCNECGTTMMKDLDGNYKPSEPHEYITNYNQNTGKPYQTCKKCYERKKVENNG